MDVCLVLKIIYHDKGVSAFVFIIFLFGATTTKPFHHILIPLGLSIMCKIIQIPRVHKPRMWTVISIMCNEAGNNGGSEREREKVSRYKKECVTYY